VPASRQEPSFLRLCLQKVAFEDLVGPLICRKKALQAWALDLPLLERNPMQSNSPLLLETTHLWVLYRPPHATLVVGCADYLQPFVGKVVLNSVYCFSLQKMGEWLSRSALLMLERIVLLLVDCSFLERQVPLIFSY
jgi:hypothetical protein